MSAVQSLRPGLRCNYLKYLQQHPFKTVKLVSTIDLFRPFFFTPVVTLGRLCTSPLVCWKLHSFVSHQHESICCCKWASHLHLSKGTKVQLQLRSSGPLVQLDSSLKQTKTLWRRLSTQIIDQSLAGHWLVTGLPVTTEGWLSHDWGNPLDIAAVSLLKPSHFGSSCLFNRTIMSTR